MSFPEFLAHGVSFKRLDMPAQLHSIFREEIGAMTAYYNSIKNGVYVMVDSSDVKLETAPGTPQLFPAPDFGASTGLDSPAPDVGDAGTGPNPRPSEQLSPAPDSGAGGTGLDSPAPDVGDAGACLESRLAEQLSPAPGTGAASSSIISVSSVAGTPIRERKGRAFQWTQEISLEKNGKGFQRARISGV